MKKMLKISLFIIIFLLNVNVFAIPDSSILEPITEPGEETKEDLKDDINSGENKTKDENNDNKDETPISKSNDAAIKNVCINEQKVVCSDNVCEFLIEDNSVENVTITYEANHEKAKLSKDKIKEEVKEGENLFKLTVTAEDGTEKEYTFKIIKKLQSTDSSLKKLIINGSEITLKDKTLKYQTTVSHAASKIVIEAIANDSKAVVKDFKNGEKSYDFYEEEKEIKIVVESEAGDITTFVVNVIRREEEDATLSKLSISNISFDFERGVFDYEVTVLRNIESLEIEYETTDKDATVKVDNPKKLDFGENIVKLEVTNDGNIKTYTIKVTKLDEEDKGLANLKSLKIEGYELDFKEDKYEYNLTIGDVNFLSIKATPKLEDSDVEITGNLDLVDGSIIKIKVTYDEDTTNIYKINIKKDVVLKEEVNSFKTIIIIVATVLILAMIVVFIILIIKIVKNKNNKNVKNNKNDNNEPKEEVITKINENINKDINNKEEKKQEKEITKNQDIISISNDEEIEDII